MLSTLQLCDLDLITFHEIFQSKLEEELCSGLDLTPRSNWSGRRHGRQLFLDILQFNYGALVITAMKKIQIERTILKENNSLPARNGRTIECMVMGDLISFAIELPDLSQYAIRHERTIRDMLNILVCKMAPTWSILRDEDISINKNIADYAPSSSPWKGRKQTDWKAAA